MHLKNIDPAIIQGRETELLNLRVFSAKFYYRTTFLTPNAFTVCLLLDVNKGIISRGISICSLSDIFEKKKGRMISFGRAFAAAKNRKSSREINFNTRDRYVNDYMSYTTKFKNKEEFTKFIQEYNDAGLRVPFFSGKDYEKNGLTLKYGVPYSWNLYYASCFFKYKSEFKPEPESYEVSVLQCSSIS